jgi:hypothetical protein
MLSRVFIVKLTGAMPWYEELCFMDILSVIMLNVAFVDMPNVMAAVSEGATLSQTIIQGI